MDEIHKLTRNDEEMVCPNCGHANMQLDPAPIFKLDGLEWFAATGNTLFIWRGMTQLVIKLLDYLLLYVTTDNPIGYFFSFVGFALSFCFSYSVAVELGRRQARKNGISVWHLRCEHCHVKYRIVRPYGAPIPWEYPEDHDQEIDNEDSE